MSAIGRTTGGILLACVTASAGWAQPAVPAGGDGRLASLAVPGGASALARSIGLDDTRPRGTILLEVIRAAYEWPEGTDAVHERHRNRLREYLGALSAFEQARAALSDNPISQGLAPSKETRRRVEDLARAIGGTLDEDRGVYRITLADDEASRGRRECLREAGVDVAALTSAFNSGAAVAVALPSDDVPLPLDARSWGRLIAPIPEFSGSLLTALLGDRRAALMYYGLLSLDGPTRAYLEAKQELLGRLLDAPRPATFATLGRSIRVRDGRVDVPGGARAVPLWEALAGERASDPGSFIPELLGRDRGRLAVLYDAIDHLDPPRQAFALGLAAPDAERRIERFKALYSALGPSLLGWDVEARPFTRPAYDAVHLLASARVLPSGELRAPAGRRFWQSALVSVEPPGDPASELKAGEPDPPADAAWLVEQLCVPNVTKRQQFVSLWLFGQRVFAGVAPADLPDAVVALRRFTRFRTLMLTLERLGVADPATYAAAARQAQRLSEIISRDVAITSLREFQGALALIERIRFGRVISSDTARRLVATLMAARLSEEGAFEGRVAEWIDTQLLPALPSSLGRVEGAEDTTEARLLAAMAGVGAMSAAGPSVTWEGLPYRVDVAGAEFARMSRIRQKQGGLGLDATLAYWRAVSHLPETLTSPAGAPARAAAIASAFEGLGPGIAALDVAGSQLPLPKWRDTVGEAVDELGKIKKQTDLAKLFRIGATLHRAGDWALGTALLSLAYAPHLGDPDGPALLAGDPAQRHSFGLDDRVPEMRPTNPWRIPQESFGDTGGWRVTGSLLGLDLGLARLSLRRLATDSLPPPPSVNEFDRSALAAAVVLSNPFDVTDAERDALAQALRRGRASVNRLSEEPSDLSRVTRAAPIGEWRQQVLPWAQEQEPARVPEYFSLSDLVRIGQAETAPGSPPDAWGTSSLGRDGCICLRYPEPATWETLAGRTGMSLMVEQVPDLTLRVAEALSGLGLPARLARAILAVATQDVLDSYRPAYSDDWAALVATVRRVSDNRMSDFVAALTSGGPLAPAGRESADDARR